MVDSMRDQILANAAELMCKINPSNEHHIKEHRLIVRRCGKGDNKGYKAVIIDFAVIRIEGPKGKTLEEAMEALFDFTAEKLKEHVKDYEDMAFSHVQGEELTKEKSGARIAMKKVKSTVKKGDGEPPAKKAKMETPSKKAKDGTPAKKT